MELSIIIPVYNSSSCLKQTVERVISSVKLLDVSFELILIDDSSLDGSWNVIKDLKTGNSNILGIRFNRNYGQHNAILCGLHVANGNYIVTIDDDLEQKPEDIATLYKVIKQSSEIDLIYGVPLHSSKGIIRNIFTTIYKKISRAENRKAGEGSSFRVFNKELKNNLLKHTGSLFFIDEIVLWYTDKIEFKKVEFNSSLKSLSGYNSKSLFSLSLRVLSLSSTMPLKVVRTLGFWIYAISIFLAMYYIARKLFFNVPMGFTTIMVTILFSTGIITFSLGIIGEYLGNLISLSNNKPSYSIKDKI